MAVGCAYGSQRRQKRITQRCNRLEVQPQTGGFPSVTNGLAGIQDRRIAEISGYKICTRFLERLDEKSVELDLQTELAQVRHEGDKGSDPRWQRDEMPATLSLSREGSDPLSPLVTNLGLD